MASIATSWTVTGPFTRRFMGWMVLLGLAVGAGAVELPSRVGTGPVVLRSKSLRVNLQRVLVPQVDLRLEAPDLSVVEAEDATANRQRPKGRVRIGIRRLLPEPVVVIGPKGPWTTLQDGTRVWSARLESAGALAVRVRVDSMQLPEGSEIRAYAADDPSGVQGPFDAESQEGRTDLWTPSVAGPVVVLECRVAAGAPLPSFRITELTHRYRAAAEDPVPRSGTLAASSTPAGPCHVDVSCESAWAATSRAVAGIGSVGVVGEIFCTGCLLNDLNEAPKTDYFLTAAHCITSQSEADTMEVYWNYQTTACNGLPPSPSTVPRTVGGAGILSTKDRSSGNDHCFLQLRGAVPAGVTYAGWNSDPPAAGEVVVGIHHPQGDYKRISLGVPHADTANYHTVRWTRGVTEVGSSGSPLFNARQQVIGQLFGGESDCAISDPSQQVDEYGRFNVTFTTVRRWLLNEPVTAPLNDSFSAAQTLTGPQGQVAGSLVDATREAGEPEHAQGGGRHSVWYLWTAPASGVVTFETVGSDFDTLLAVYQGDALNQLVRVGQNDDLELGQTASRVGFLAASGGIYRIAVDGRDGAQGSVVLSWRPGGVANPPPNDLFSNAAPTLGFGGVYRGNNRGFTREPLEPSHAGGSGQRSAWWRWTAPISAPTVINTLDSSFDTLLAVYTGESVSALVRVAENDDIVEPIDSIQSEVLFDAVAGVTYRIAVDGFGNGTRQEDGLIRLDISQKGGQPSGNDRFAAATEIGGSRGAVTANNRGFSGEIGEPTHAGVRGGRSAWWRWTAPADGMTRFETTGSAFDTLLAVYTGDSLQSLKRVVDNDDIIPGDVWQSRAEFKAVKGTVYRIAVDGFFDAGPPILQEEGNIRLAWEQQTAPPTPQPFSLAPSWSPQGRFEVRLTGQAGVRYALERNRSLSAGGTGWVRLVTAEGTGVPLVLSEIDPPGFGTATYFRVVTVP